MSEIDPRAQENSAANEPGANGEKQKQPKIGGNWWQSFSLRTLFLLCLCTSTWVAYFIQSRKREQTELKLMLLRSDAAELRVENPAAIAAVSTEHPFSDTKEFQVYVPSGSFHICVATQQLGDYYSMHQEPSSEAVLEVPILPGTHHLRISNARGELMHNGEVIPPVLYIDEQAYVIEVGEDWKGQGSYVWFGTGRHSQEFPPTQTAVIYKNLFLGKSADFDSDQGIELWIEPDQ